MWAIKVDARTQGPVPSRLATCSMWVDFFLLRPVGKPDPTAGVGLNPARIAIVVSRGPQGAWPPGLDAACRGEGAERAATGSKDAAEAQQSRAPRRWARAD